MRLTSTAVVLVILTVVMAGCDVGPEELAAPPTRTATTPPTTGTPTSPAEQQSPSPTPALEVRRVELTLPPAGELNSAWRQQMFVPYGEDVERLGVAGTHGGPPWGPEFGAPAADGTWWFLDSNKRRVARYTADGEFLGEAAVRSGNMGVQMPYVLDSGWLYATGDPALVADANAAVRLDVPPGERLRVWSYSDWTSVYSDDGGTIHTLTVKPDGEVEWGRADHFLTPDGRRFLARVNPRDRGGLRVWLPDARPAPLRVDLAFTAGEPEGARIEPGVEVAADGAGRIHLLVYGHVTDVQLAGYTSISPDGTVEPIEPIRNPFSKSDPGSPAHLRTIPGTKDVALTFVDTDGVRVYVRSY